MNSDQKTRIKELAYVLTILGVLYAFFHFSGIGCPIRFLTGVSCPGCGMTRACISVLFLDFKSAFYYHPLFLILPVGISVLLLKDRIPHRVYGLCVSFIVSMFLITYVVRILFSDGQIVSVHPDQSVLYRWYFILKEGMTDVL